jgi:ribonuclease P protein subunit RPR2
MDSSKPKLSKQRHQQKPREHIDTALERIRILFEEADKAFSAGNALSKCGLSKAKSTSKGKPFSKGDTFSKDKTGRNLSGRYISLARKIAMKYKTPIPSELKKRFCKSCGVFLKPSINCRVRLNKGKAVYTCLSCGSSQRYPYAKRASSHSKTQKISGQTSTREQRSPHPQKIESASR